MSRDTAEAEAGMKGITFPAWHGKHYVTLAELLVRLGSFGLDLTWRVEFDEIVDPRCVEMEKLRALVRALDRRILARAKVIPADSLDVPWWRGQI
ncbi:hypothetical protein ACWD5F_19810 [Streptomyces sp. NPDC002499]